MSANRSDFADLAYFLAIARHQSFRLAGTDVGVNTSALTHAIKGLEARLGVRLPNGTNRSVTLTAAGAELRDAIAGPYGAINEAVENLNRYRDAPVGRIRINTLLHAIPTLLGPVLPTFAERYPDIEVEIAASNRLVDVVGAGFDAGIRHGGTVPEDMIAQRISADLRWVIAASPAYLDRYGVPNTPADLARHQCIGVRLGDERIYQWELTDPDGNEIAVSVPGRFITDDATAMVALAAGGVGLAYGEYSMFADRCARGELKLVLEDWATTSPGYHIYYSSRHQVPSGLRLLINLIREMRPMGL